MFASAPAVICPCCRGLWLLWVQGCGADRVPQAPVGKSGHVAHGAIHGKDAAGEFAIRFAMNRAAAIFYFDLDGAELIGAIRHASGGGGIGDQNRAFDAFGPQKVSRFRARRESIRDNVRAELSLVSASPRMPGSR